MTIEKGQSWGEPALPGSDLATAADDAELAEIALAAHHNGESLTATVETGDLLHTLGVTEHRPPAERYAYPIDLGLVTLNPGTNAVQDRTSPGDRTTIPFVAHLVAARKALPGLDTLEMLLGHGPPIDLAIMNAAWLGHLRLGPRAHPNDGRLDVVEGRVRFRERREANKRAMSGSHLPHPVLRTSRVSAWQSKFDHPVVVTVDGVRRGKASSISVELVPDALTVVA